MNTYDIYAKYRDIKGYKDAQVAELSGFGRSTFSDWKSGRSIPKEPKLEKIAAVLGVTTYELRTGCKPEVPSFDARHIELIDLFSKLSDSQQEIILNTMRAFVNDHMS